MADVALHGVTAEVVMDALPFDTSGVTATSRPVSTMDLDGWITEGAGIINSLLERHGIDPASGLKPNGAQLVRRGVIGYAAAAALRAAGVIGAKVDGFMASFHAVDDRIRTDPRSLGDSQDAASIVVSNIDQPTRKNWDSKNFKGW